MEQQELYCRIVLHIGYHSLIVRPDTNCPELSVLCNNTHKDITLKVEEGIGDFIDGMTVVADGGVHFCHIGLYLCPFLYATRLHVHIVVVLQRSTFRSGISKDLMQASPPALPYREGAFHTLHNKLVSLHVLYNLSSSLSLPLQVKDFLRIWHLQTFHCRIVLVGRIIDTADASALHSTRFRPFAVESRAVLPRLKRHVITKVIPGSIFKAF